MCAFLSWGLVLSTLIAYRWYHANALKAFIFPIVLVLAAIAAISPDSAGQTHRSSAILFKVSVARARRIAAAGYASFFVAFGAGVMYIIQERELKLNGSVRSFTDCRRSTHVMR